MESKTVKSGGIGFVGLLQLLFIALKLIGIIDWPWVFVLLPFIISAGFVCGGSNRPTDRRFGGKQVEAMCDE